MAADLLADVAYDVYLRGIVPQDEVLLESRKVRKQVHILSHQELALKRISERAGLSEA